MGMAVLAEHLRVAGAVLTQAVTGTYQSKQVHESLCFVQGSGLEMTIQLFGLDVDAESLRERFYYWATRQRHKSQ